MARIRTIKPDFFRHVELYEAEQETGLPLRVAYAGLWTAADREGRFKWAPKELKLDCLPHDDVDFSRVLDALITRGFVVRYASHGKEYGAIPTFKQHQVINNREKPSEIPEPNETNVLTRASRVDDACVTPRVQDQGEGKGREGKGSALDADASHLDFPAPQPTDEAELYRRSKQILGPSCGGLVKKLIAAKGNSIPLARSAIEMASTKGDPREYIGAIIRGRGDSPEDLRARGEAW